MSTDNKQSNEKSGDSEWLFFGCFLVGLGIFCGTMFVLDYVSDPYDEREISDALAVLLSDGLAVLLVVVILPIFFCLMILGFAAWKRNMSWLGAGCFLVAFGIFCGTMFVLAYGFDVDERKISDLLFELLLVVVIPPIFFGLMILGFAAWKRIAKKRREQEYVKLFAEFKQDGMNEATYEKIMLFLNDGKYRGNLDVATAPPEKIQRFIEVVSLRYYAILDRLQRADSPALRSELLNLRRKLRGLTPYEWSNDLAALSPVVKTGGSVNVAKQLAELGELRNKGVITQEEFDRGKALFLGNPPDIAAKTLDVLDGLYKLKMNGALSESEYNIKKWELLAGKNLKPK
jgi:protein-S-isoprenylcysteine O-methyltransferase Ste14